MANGSTQSKFLFTVIPHDLGLMPRFETGEARIVFGLSASGDGVVSDGGTVVLAVYDLDQYIQHQVNLTNGDFDIGTFTGAKSTFSAPLQDHEVRGGTGVLFLAELTFSKHPAPKSSAENWVVTQVARKEEINSPAFELSIQMLARIDDAGNTAPLSPIQYQTVGVVGPATVDFNEFVQTKGGHRKLAVRILSADSSTVLLSQLNVVHCAAASPLLIRYANNGRRPKVGQPAPGLEKAIQNLSRRPPFDPSGLYVQRLPPFDKPVDVDDIDAPGSLWLHQIGRTLVGWYYPLPSQILTGTNPNTGQPFFTPGQQAQLLSGSRLCFLATPNLHSWGVQFLQKKPKENATHFVALQSSGPGDDPDLLNTTDAATQFAGRLLPGWIQLHNTGNDALVPSVSVSLSDATAPALFVRATTQSKLSYELEAILNNTLATGVNQIDPGTQQAIVSAVRSQLVEPLPPKILSELVRGIIGPSMIQAVVDWNAANDASNLTAQRVAEIELDNALSAIANGLVAASPNGTISDELIAEVRGMAKTSTVLGSNFFGAKNVTILDTLEQAMGAMVQRDVNARTGTIGTLPREADYNTFIQSTRLPGFQAFGIRPDGKFKYKLTFTPVTLAEASLILVKGSVGGFRLVIEKTNNDGTTDQQFPPTSYFGLMLGGGVGAKVEFKPFSDFKNPSSLIKAGGSGSPVDCEITSFLNLTTLDFQFARMTFFAQALPGINISAGFGVGVKSGESETIVSITLPLRIPTAVIETTVKSGEFLKPKVSGPNVDSVKSELEKWKKALKSGKAQDVPTAQVSVALYRLSLCVAIILFDTAKNPIKRPDDQTVDVLIDKTQQGTILMRGAEFPINSAVVTEKAHQLLEVRLAVQRKLLEYQGGFMDIQGTTSPEWADAQRKEAAGQLTPEQARTEAKTANHKLSTARAEAVRDAIFASVGAPGHGLIDAGRDVLAFGLGADPFDPTLPAPTPPPGTTASPRLVFTDPFTPGAAQSAQVLAEQANLYWKMRNVDIEMNGVFTIRIKGATSSENK